MGRKRTRQAQRARPGSARETAADDSLIKGRGQQGSAGRIGRGLRGDGAQPRMSDVSGLEAALGGKQPKNCCARARRLRYPWTDDAQGRYADYPKTALIAVEGTQGHAAGG